MATLSITAATQAPGFEKLSPRDPQPAAPTDQKLVFVWVTGR